MPEDLWQVAVLLTRKHGLNPVARALNLDYYSLKRRSKPSGGKRVRASQGGSRNHQKESSPPAFVEVGLTSPQIPPECVLELVGPRGVKMTVRLRGAVDVVALVEAFWRRRR